MSVADNFDYSLPTLSKKDTMSLSTINSNDAKIRPFKKMDTQRDWSINLYNLDIERSCPKRFGVFTNKVDFINKVDDIERTNPKILHYKLDKPEYNLSNADIEKSSPNMGNLKTTRCTNPLEPKYNLAKVEELPNEIPRFIRDSIDIKDIDGAKPKKYFKWQTRETFPADNHGIAGSKPKKKYVRQTKYNNIDYSDLTRDIFKTKRHTNPLDPVYELKYKNGENYTYGLIEKSKPQTNYPYSYPEPFALRVNDIMGAQAGTKNRINKFTGNNYELTTKDIRGCSAGSLKKGITTQRCTNPLVPKYQMPGAVELNGIQNDPFARTAGFNMMKGKTPIQKIPTPKIEQKKPASAKQETPKLEEQKNQNNDNSNYELGYNHQLYKEDKINFNKDNYKKPEPFYGFIHDKYVCSSENPDVRPLIDKRKTDMLMSKTSNAFYNSGSNNLNKTLTHNGAVSSGQIKTPSVASGLNNYNSNIPNQMQIDQTKSMNRTTRDGGFKKMTYAQKLDQFMETNKLKYINEKPPQPKIINPIPMEKVPEVA